MLAVEKEMSILGEEKNFAHQQKSSFWRGREKKRTFLLQIDKVPAEEDYEDTVEGFKL